MQSKLFSAGAKGVGAARLALLAGAVVGLALFSSATATACSILPPRLPPALAPMPGESASDFQARQTLHFDGFAALQQQNAGDAVRQRQQDVWTRADKVAVVEIVSVETGVEIPNMPIGRGVRATVKPVGWLKGRPAKGRAGRTAFTLAHTSYTSCGPSPSWPVFSGQKGDRFLVFLNANAPAQDATMDAIKPSDIVLGDLSTALAFQVR